MQAFCGTWVACESTTDRKGLSRNKRHVQHTRLNNLEENDEPAELKAEALNMRSECDSMRAPCWEDAEAGKSLANGRTEMLAQVLLGFLLAVCTLLKPVHDHSRGRVKTHQQ